jgi:S1-C subfamily serine protease
MRDDDPGTAGGNANEPESGTETAGNPGAAAGLWAKRSVRIAASAAAVVLAAGIGLGVTSAVRGSVPADARIPVPPARNAVFVEDDDGAGADQQGSILQSSAGGVVSIRSARGAAVGAGFVITRSGYVLAAYHGLPGAGTLTARLVMSGKAYPARLVGSDPEANLALLQLSGGTGFAPVAIGTTADIHLNDRVASAGGNQTAEGLLLTTGAITGIGVPVTLDGHRLTGLLEVSSLAVPASELGGPLFNLSGQVLGLSIGIGTGWGTGDGYVVPIDSALQIARQIAGQ